MNQQIISLYDQGLNIDEIASAMELSTDAVRLVLASGSRKYANHLKNENQKLFSNEDLANASIVMSGLLYSEHDSVKFRASKFIINENLGRHDVKNNIININVSSINEQLLKAKSAIAAGKTKLINDNETIIDVT